MSSQIPINLPNRVRSGDPITAEWANAIRDCLQRLANRRVQMPTPLANTDTKPPFWPTVSKSGETWRVKVSTGVISEEDPYAKNRLLHYEPSNASTKENENWLNIDNGKAVYLRVAVLDTGEIDPASDPQFVVDDDDATDPKSVDGYYYYPIASFEIAAGNVTMTLRLAGSHIFHTAGRDLNLGLWTESTNATPDPITVCFRNGRFIGAYNEGETIPSGDNVVSVTTAMP